MNYPRYIITLLISAMAVGLWAQPSTTKRERNYIKEGNALFAKQRYAEAEVAYRKALEENAASEVATFNLASSLLKQSGSADPNKGNNPMSEATKLLTDLAKNAQTAAIAEKAFYNLGNISFNNEKYQESIDMYKNALRRNPDNNDARDNLRLAQLKLQQQQNQQQNQDKDQNKDNKQDKNQNQDKDQNKDNKDNKDNKQDKDQNNGNQDKEKSDNKQDQQPQGISDANAEKILKTMENEENATRRRVNAQKQEKDAKASKRHILKPW